MLNRPIVPLEGHPKYREWQDDYYRKMTIGGLVTTIMLTGLFTAIGGAFFSHWGLMTGGLLVALISYYAIRYILSLPVPPEERMREEIWRPR